MVSRASFSHNGRMVVSESRDRTIKVWDARRGVIQREFEGSQGATAGCSSPDSKHVASVGLRGVIHVWDTSTGVGACEPFKGHEGQVTSSAMVRGQFLGPMVADFTSFGTRGSSRRDRENGETRVHG